MILATKPYFPDQSKYNDYVDGIWQSGWLTNNSIHVRTLEERLIDFLGIPNIATLNNGTIALQIAIKALELKGEIITTPFSYVATTSSIVWENCKPVFTDIEADTFSLDAGKIEEAITPNTTAIMATHVYGNPCDVEAIDTIAKKHGLKVIYDAAHAFGVKWKGQSVLNYGDISTLSFHATKLFHTVEGGAVIATDEKVAEIMEYQRRFGHNGPYEFHGIGVNAKLSEPHAAFGLCVLDDMDEILSRRKEQWLFYEAELQDADVHLLRIRTGVDYNFAYFPVRFNSEAEVLNALRAMEAAEIFPRRYFYPSLNKLDYVEYRACPISEKVAPCMLCLPLYHDLSREDQLRILTIIKENID